MQSTSGPPTPATGLRERKKRQTQDALSLAARELVHQRGLDDVTVEDIAAAADVSVRTFFNHFSSKEEAVVGVDRRALDEVAEELRQRPAGEGAATALRAVLFAHVDSEGMLRRWELRNQLVRDYPALLPRYLAAIVQVEEALAAALAERMDVDIRTDPTPRVLVATALAVIRSTLDWWWESSDCGTDFTDILDRTFSRLMPDPGGRP